MNAITIKKRVKKIVYESISIVVHQSTFGNNLQRLRKENGMSLQDVAKQIGVSRQAVSQWELETYPSIETLLKLSGLFNTTPNELLGYFGSDKQERDQ